MSKFITSCCFISILVCILACNSFDNESANYKSAYPTSYSKQESFEYFEFKNLIEEFSGNPKTYDFYREFKKFISNTADKIESRNPKSWISIGPYDIPGRSLCLCINPLDTNELWMGSAGSGIWKSTTGGLGLNAWTNVPTGFPVISVASITIQANNPNIIYIGTGEIYTHDGTDGGLHTRTLRGSKGIGILKSIDAGKSWKLSLDWTQNNQTSVWKIIIHPHNTNIIFAASNVGIFKSENGGETWKQVLNIPLTLDMIIDHSKPAVLYTGVGGINRTHYGVYRSLDEGETWEFIKSPNDTMYHGRIMLANYKSNPKRILAAYSDAYKTIGMLRTGNGFKSSFYVPIKDVCDHQGWYAKCLHIKDDDSSKILMGGVDLYKDNSGTGNQLFNLNSKKINIHADLHDIISNPLDPDKVYVATDGGMFRSNNFGESFIPANHGFLSAQFYNGCTSKLSDKLLGGLQDNRSALFENNLWRGIHQGDGTFCDFHPDDENILYVSAQNQNLSISTNNGLNWKELIKPNINAAFVAPFMINPVNGNELYSGGNELLHSIDAGFHWDTTSFLSSDEIAVSITIDPTQSDKIFVSTLNLKQGTSHLYISDNSGKDLYLSDHGIPERFIRDHAIDPLNPEVIYIALGGSGTPGIMKSINGGLDWQFTENLNLADVPIHTILIDPRDHEILYAGTDFGLFVSLNSGKTWNSYNNHKFDLVSVYDIKYSIHQNSLILFSHGYGAFLCPLIDKSIIVKTSESGTTEYYINNEAGTLYIPSLVGNNKTLHLADIRGCIWTLTPEDNYYSIKNLNNGVYSLISGNSKLRNIKILIIR